MLVLSVCGGVCPPESGAEFFLFIAIILGDICSVEESDGLYTKPLCSFSVQEEQCKGNKWKHVYFIIAGHLTRYCRNLDNSMVMILSFHV